MTFSERRLDIQLSCSAKSKSECTSEYKNKIKRLKYRKNTEAADLSSWEITDSRPTARQSAWD